MKPLEENSDGDLPDKQGKIENHELQPQSFTLRPKGVVTLSYEFASTLCLACRLLDQLGSLPHLNLQAEIDMQGADLRLFFSDRDFDLGRVVYSDFGYDVQITADTILHELENSSLAPVRVDGQNAAVAWTRQLAERLNSLEHVWSSGQVIDAGEARAARGRA